MCRRESVGEVSSKHSYANISVASGCRVRLRGPFRAVLGDGLFVIYLGVLLLSRLLNRNADDLVFT